MFTFTFTSTPTLGGSFALRNEPFIVRVADYSMSQYLTVQVNL